jgi:hypothetical protein
MTAADNSSLKYVNIQQNDNNNNKNLFTSPSLQQEQVYGLVIGLCNLFNQEVHRNCSSFSFKTLYLKNCYSLEFPVRLFTGRLIDRIHFGRYPNIASFT